MAAPTFLPNSCQAYIAENMDKVIAYIQSLEHLPTVAVADAGKVLTVDETGKWVAAAPAE